MELMLDWPDFAELDQSWKSEQYLIGLLVGQDIRATGPSTALGPFWSIGFDSKLGPASKVWPHLLFGSGLDLVIKSL